MDQFIDEMKQYTFLWSLAQWAVQLVPLIGGVMAAYHVIMRMKAEDEHTAAQHSRSFRNVVIGSLVIAASAGMVYWAIGSSKYSDPAKPCYGLAWGEKCPPP